MEKLSETRRDAIKKMSTVRLTNKLIQLGFDIEQLESMDRPDMMEAFAELIVAGKDEPTAAGAMADPGGAVSGMTMMMADPELQKQFLQLEIAKLEEARRAREEKLEWERQIKQEELELRRRELVRQENKDRIDADRFGATVTKVKLYGDAFRNAAFRMGNDALDALPFFEHCERVFADIECPAAIQTQLIRPYLSDRAKQLLSKLDPARAAIYREMKEYILHELKLSPAAYLEKFNNLRRNDSDTCVAFVSKLRTLLSHYVQSRHVDESYDRLFSLLICDRIKSSLTDNCLRHILSVESNTERGWLGMSELADQVDLYMANHFGDRPRAAAIGTPTRNAPSNSTVSLPKQTESTSANAFPRSNGDSTNGKRCYHCHSPHHEIKDCPVKSNNNAQRRQPVIINQSSTELPMPTDSDSASSNQTSFLNHVTANQVSALEVNNDDVYGSHATGYEESLIRSTEVEVDEAYRYHNSDITPVMGAMQTFQCCTIPNNDIQARIQETELAKLNYYDVCIDGVARTVQGLSDSGAQLSVCHSDVVRELNLEPIGNVMLRGIVGQPVMAKLVNLYIKLADCDCEFIPIVCAVCDLVNETLILASNVVERLTANANRKASFVDNLDDVDSAVNAVNINQTESNDNSNDDDNVNEPDCSENDIKSELGKASADLLRQEQLIDNNLTEC